MDFDSREIKLKHAARDLQMFLCDNTTTNPAREQEKSLTTKAPGKVVSSRCADFGGRAQGPSRCHVPIFSRSGLVLGGRRRAAASG
jgi:hypothetical protein